MKKKLLSVMLALCLAAGTATCPYNTNVVYVEEEGDFKYEVWNGTVEITGYLGHERNVVIPSEINGKKVKIIGTGVFQSSTRITNITIPNSVTSIGERAFSGCTELTSITLPDNITSIGDSAFDDCTGLTSITIPDSVMSINDGAFSGCTGLTSITIPDSVTSIGYGAFYRCTGLKSIEVDVNNKKYLSIDGVVYSKNKKNLLICPGGKVGSLSIPNSVTSIGDSAFSGCTGHTSITLPDSVKSIGTRAFSNCTGLTSITIPDSIIVEQQIVIHTNGKLF